MKFLDTYGIIKELSPQIGEFIDERDGKKYQTVTIGNLEWFRENLVYDDTNDFYGENSGVLIDMFDLVSPSKEARHNSSLKNCGRLYMPWAANNACPYGWEIPTTKDWRDLVESIIKNKWEESSKEDLNKIYFTLFGKNSPLNLEICGYRSKDGFLQKEYTEALFLSRRNPSKKDDFILFMFSEHPMGGIFKCELKKVTEEYFAIRPVRKKI